MVCQMPIYNYATVCKKKILQHTNTRIVEITHTLKTMCLQPNRVGQVLFIWKKLKSFNR